MDIRIIFVTWCFIIASPIFCAQVKTSMRQKNFINKIEQDIKQNESYAQIINDIIVNMSKGPLLKEFALQCLQYKNNYLQETNKNGLQSYEFYIKKTTLSSMREYLKTLSQLTEQEQEYILEQLQTPLQHYCSKYLASSSHILGLAQAFIRRDIQRNAEAVHVQQLHHGN